MARIPLFTRAERGWWALAAAVLGVFAVPTIIELIGQVRSGAPQNLPLLILGALVFGVPALAALVVVVRPPRPVLLIDEDGLRFEDAARSFALTWEEVRTAGICLGWRNRFAVRGPVRLLNRRVDILFGMDPERVLPSALRPFVWAEHPEFTHAVRIVVSPLAGEDPPVVQALATAIDTAGRGRFAGVLTRVGATSPLQ